MTKAMFDSAKTGFEISIGLTGVMTLWLGIMQIAERGGFIQLLSRALAPLFSRLFPEIPAGHPALGSMSMNIAANALGLDNAATPLGLKAMQELQELNPVKKHRQQCANPVSGDQHRIGDTVSGNGVCLSGTNGGGQSD
jgi:spore maturation protein SpmA